MILCCGLTQQTAKTVTQLYACHHPCSEMGKGVRKKVKLTGLDKDILVGQKRKRTIIMIKNIQSK